jgi:heptosyltransferase-2
METRRILLVRFSSLGDLLLLLCVPPALASRFPGARLDVLVKGEYREAIEGQSGVGRVLAYDPATGLSGLIRLGRRLRREGYDLVYDAHGSIRSRLLAAVLRPPNLVRIRKDTFRRLLLVAGRRNGLPPGRTMIHRYLEPLERFGIDPLPWRPGFRPGAAARSRAEEERRTLPGPHLALAPGARWTAKRWRPDGFARLGDAFVRRRGGTVWIVGGPEDREPAEATAARMTAPARVVAGRLALAETAALLASCEGLVTNDSALLHLAEAVDTPVAALFGPTVTAFGYAPRLPESRVLEREIRCRPCSRNGRRPCPRGTRECLADLEPDLALERLASWGPLAGAGATAGGGDPGSAPPPGEARSAS